MVVVVDVNEPPEPEVPGQRSGFVADPFHQVAVAADHEGVVVDQVRAVLGAEDPFGDAHPYAVGEALPERAGRDLDAFQLVDSGWPGVRRTELAELGEVLQGQVVTREEQHRIKKDAKRGRKKG